MPVRREVVFVHIPKTGGTSVRRSLELGLKGRLFLRDYQDHPLATPELNDLVHVQGRVQDFRKHYPGDRRMLLAGHFPASRYWDYFNAESFVTFLRNPVDRMVSAYVSWVKQGKWKGSFEDFAAQPASPRRMAGFLAEVDLRTFGFIGFLEEYEQSFAALCEFIGAELPARNINPGNYSRAQREDMSAMKAVAVAALEGSPDLRLYQQLHKVRAGVYRAAGGDRAVSHAYAGHVQREGDTITGWLVNTAREFIPEVEVWRAEEQLAAVKADRYLEDAKADGRSRSGVCGFRLALRKLDVTPGTTLMFRARKSTYELEGSPLVV
jgi:hypothetical protein